SLVPSRSDMGELFNPEEIARQYKIDLNDFLENGFYYAKYKMSEPLDEFKEAITEYQQIGKWLNAIEIAKKGKTAPLRALLLKEEHYQEVAKHGEVGELLQTAGFDLSFQLVEAQGSIKRSVVLGGDGKLKTLWGFDSLLDAAYFYLIQDLSFNYWVGECARCGRLFLSSAGKQEYCSRTCQDTTRKAASRKAKKGAK
ncbi:MAG: hypothetical protein PHD36_05360, partial [Desulfotomaculaceae bacterium]|nr:hypothetical protein [Desulfotomaculaceae bacterium]